MREDAEVIGGGDTDAGVAVIDAEGGVDGGGLRVDGLEEEMNE
jgi:hypothetical protein